MELEIVVAQNPASLDGPQDRYDWLAESLHNPQVRGADIVVLPELFLTGYNIGEKVHEWSEPLDGPFAKQVSKLCIEHCIAIHYGYAENHRGKVYNSVNCFGCDGQRLGGHRKLLLPPGFEGDHFVSGKTCETFSINGFNIGTLICYDAEFPENFRQVAKLGVDLVLVPTALAAQWDVVAYKIIPARAFENGIFVCYANQSGSEHGLEYLGGSCIVGPDGKDIRRAGSLNEFLRARLCRDQVNIAQDRLPYLHDLKKLPWL